MLTQYNTWILIGVMQEKSSRVVEVLLATVRPIQLLGGKVLGIGLVALGQATLIVGFALIVGTAVGSDLLHGTAPLVLACELLWLVLGYAFYCWVYAAAGSTAERQDQVQTLALPLSIPILVGYIFSHHRGELGQPGPLLQGPRLPAPDGPVLHARARRAGPGHLVGVRRLGADHHRRDGRHGDLRRPHLPPGRAAHRRPGACPRALRSRAAARIGTSALAVSLMTYAAVLKTEVERRDRERCALAGLVSEGGRTMTRANRKCDELATRSADHDEADRPGAMTTRRAVIIGAAAGLAGLVADSVISSEPAGAASGDTVLLGNSNSSSATTEITTTSGDGLQGSTSDNYSYGVYGENTGVNGTGAGVYGTGNTYGVYGSGGTDGIGVYGSGGTFGVFAIGGTYGVNGQGPTGVYGYSYTGGIGVEGTATGGGVGVFGHGSYRRLRRVEDPGGHGTKGQGTNGATGVYGVSDKGTACWRRAPRVTPFKLSARSPS